MLQRKLLHQDARRHLDIRRESSSLRRPSSSCLRRRPHENNGEKEPRWMPAAVPAGALARWRARARAWAERHRSTCPPLPPRRCVVSEGGCVFPRFSNPNKFITTVCWSRRWRGEEVVPAVPQVRAVPESLRPSAPPPAPKKSRKK